MDRAARETPFDAFAEGGRTPSSGIGATVPRSGLSVHPVVDEGLGNTSWLVDVGGSASIVFDPCRDPGPYLSMAERMECDVALAIETHLHADFVSGSRELAARGAKVIAPGTSGIEFPYQGLEDGDEIDVGDLTLRALATPGHTPEHLAYLLLRGGRPLALFSGGSLLVGAVARTDLISAQRTEALARQLWRSLHSRILSLPDELPVYPTHGAGSFCSASGSSERWTTIGAERAGNPLLRAPDEDAFVSRLLGALGTYPPYFLRLRELNRRGAQVYGDDPPALTPLDPTEVKALVGQGAELVDVRPVEAFASGHVGGSLSIPLRPQFASWLGWLVPAGKPLVFVVDEGQDRSELVRQCLKIGYEDLAGEVSGGIGAWTAAGLLTDTLRLVSPDGIDAATVLDVRQNAEFAAGHLPGSSHVELGKLTDPLVELPPGPLTLLCGHGERALTGAALLARAGRRELSVVVGGPEEWSRYTGRPLTTGS